MYPRKTFRIATAVIFLLAGIFFVIQGCKKGSIPLPGSGNPDNPEPYYFSATVDGTLWEANMAEAFDTTIILPEDSGVALALVGAKVQDGDTTAIAINFLAKGTTGIKLNKPFTFIPDGMDINDSSIIAVLLYYGSFSNSTQIYATPATQNEGIRGAITFTQLDTAQNIIAGTFHATATSIIGIPITLANGKFKTRIATSRSQLIDNVLADAEY